MFREVRRKDRLLNEDRINCLLEEGEYGFLSLCGINGYGYGIPISFVRSGNYIYFHCAPEGYKLDCLKENPKVSFCVVGHTQVIPGSFTTGYESVIVFGEIEMNLPDEECLEALRLLVRKYSLAFKERGEKYIGKSFDRTQVLRLDIHHFTGKCRQVKE